MNIRDWFSEETQRFHNSNDSARLRMVQLSSDGYDLREKDPDRAVALFREGKQQAEALGEPWWALYYHNKLVEAMLHFQRDFRTVLDLAMEAVLEARKPTNTQFPGNISAWDNLVTAYLGIDAEGYEEPIMQALAHLDQEIPPEPDGPRYLLLARREMFALETDRWKDAYDAALEQLKLAAADRSRPRSAHYTTFVYCGLCHIGGALRVWDSVGEWARLAEGLAREVGHQCELSEAQAWQAVAAAHAGEKDLAHRLHRAAIARMARLKMPPKRGYYDALVVFHEWEEDLAKAVAARDDELRTIQDRGRLLYETKVRIDRANLKARMGLLSAEDLEGARAVASKLKKPERYLEQIRVLAEGGVLPPPVVDSSFVTAPAAKRERAAPPAAKAQKAEEKPGEQKDSNSKKRKF